MNNSRQFQIFTKPVGSSCNLSCSYCYYHTADNGKTEKRSMLDDDELLAKYIVQHIEATTDNVVFFSWHGGEPTLAGIEFYKKSVAIQKKYLPTGKRLLNGLQTNGTLLDEKWGRFLKDENFIVGISIDGPEELHNRFRKYHSKSNRNEMDNLKPEIIQKGSFERVMKGLGILKLFEIPFEILCVVNSVNVLHPLEVYHFFRELGARYITFLPLVERVGVSSLVSERTAPAEDFGRFLIRIFDEWLVKDIGRIQVQIFEETLQTAFKKEHSLCIFKVNCGGVPVIENNGDFYSCDHFADQDHYLGNISRKSISRFLDSEPQKLFGRLKSESLSKFCRQCEVLEMCNGECPKNRFIKTPEGESGLNYLCSGYRMFFNHCRPVIEEIRKNK